MVASSTVIITDESGLSATIAISLSSQPTADVTFPVSSSDTSEGTVDKSSLVFTSANWANSQTITVTGTNDALTDGNQNYNIHLGPAVSTDASYSGLQQYITATNLEVRNGSFVVSPISGDTSEDGSTATFTVRLGSAPTAVVTLPIQSSDTSEGIVDKTSLTFTTLDWQDYQTVTVTGVPDAIPDNQTYSVLLGPAVSTDSVYNNVDPDDLVLTNRDLRIGSFDITPTSGTTDEYGGQFTIQVRLNIQPTDNVDIPVISSLTTEGTVFPASLAFNTGNWDQYQTVTVTGVEDNIVDADQPYSISLGPAVSTDSAYNNLVPAPVAMTNRGRALGLMIAEISGNTDEAGLQATLLVRLDSKPADTVVIPSITSSDPTEGTVSPTSLTFAPEDWDTGLEVTITGVDDDIADGNVEYSINLGPTTSTDAYFNGLTATVAVTNVDLVDPYGVTPRISAGDKHSLVLASDGTVWGWGKCASGQLESADSATCSGTFTLPQRQNITRASAVSAGLKFSVMVKGDDGSVWTCGEDVSSKLGHTGSPLARVDGLTDVNKVATGASHVLALKNDGTVWAWGTGNSGRLGNGGDPNINSLTPVPATGDLTGKTVIDIAAGAGHSLALDSTGAVYSWGSDYSGQLGNGATTTGDVLTPTAIGLLTNVSNIAAGENSSFAVGTYSGTSDVYGWGRNWDFILGTAGSGTISDTIHLPTGLETFTPAILTTRISVGTSHTLALSNENPSKVYSWGDNDGVDPYDSGETQDNFGALGITSSPISDRTVPTATDFANGTGATDIAAGRGFSLVLLNDGRLQSAGTQSKGTTTYNVLGTNSAALITIPASTGNTGDPDEYKYIATPTYVEDPGDAGPATSTHFYAYRPILSGQPASSTTNTTTTVTVCAPAVAAYCTGITHYQSSTDNGGTWSAATLIATPITLSSLTGPVNLWVKGMKGTNIPISPSTAPDDRLQTDASAVKVSWTVVAPLL